MCNADNLNPCPACGSEAEFTRIGSHRFVRCVSYDCGLSGPIEDVDGEKWNALRGIASPDPSADLAAAKDAEIERLTLDEQRIDFLESVIWSNKTGNGVAIFPSTSVSTGEKGVSLDDLGDEDGSNLGESISGTCSDLRDAIDTARAALNRKDGAGPEALAKGEGCAACLHASKGTHEFPCDKCEEGDLFVPHLALDRKEVDNG